MAGNFWNLPKDIDVQIQQPELIIERKYRNSHICETEMVLTHNKKTTILRMGFFKARYDHVLSTRFSDLTAHLITQSKRSGKVCHATTHQHWV